MKKIVCLLKILNLIAKKNHFDVDTADSFDKGLKKNILS